MSTSVLIILTLAGIATSILSAVVGMAGGVTLLSVMSFFLPLSLVIPLHGIIQLVSNGSRVWLLRHHAIKSIVVFFVLGLPLGAYGAYQILLHFGEQKQWQLLIAVLIFYVLFKPKKLPSLAIPPWAFFLVGILIGLLGPLIGASGPLLAVFFLRPHWSKQQIVATKAAVQTLGHLIKIPTFMGLGLRYQDFAWELALLSSAAILGTRVGISLLGKISEKVFVTLYRSVLFLAALRILWKFIFSS